MGTIKIELDIPDFNKELEIKVILNKDGVQQCTSPLVTTTNPYQSQIKSNEEVMTNITNPNVASIRPTTTVTYNQNQPVQPQVQQKPDISNIPSSMTRNF